MILNAACRVVTVSVLLCAIGATAGASELSDGMKLFFDGDYKNAHHILNQMVTQGHVDARVHYFRGLTSQRLGDAQAAALDFRTGAKLEVSGATHGVGEALQRVQGLERLQLERYPHHGQAYVADPNTTDRSETDSTYNRQDPTDVSSSTRFGADLQARV